ncbi:LysR family transcriptional regulator [Nannocystis pusilla]|uniref:LysR family transcriptional regulator n=1 Tax=Nannocystis pusilla TaxID=889268 RepID=UPI003B81C5D4
MDLAAIDLNLFLVLDAVLTEGSATAAARRLHVTQSAVSNALARLREVVGDPLVVRRGRGLAPTPVAVQLQPRIAAGLHELRAALAAGREFDPATTTRRFSIALTDNQEVSDLPRIVARFERQLPCASLQVVTVERLIASDGLAAGLVDLALAPAAVTAPGLRQTPLYSEQGVLVVRRDNRKVGRRLDRAAFEATPTSTCRSSARAATATASPATTSPAPACAAASSSPSRTSWPPQSPSRAPTG